MYKGLLASCVLLTCLTGCTREDDRRAKQKLHTAGKELEHDLNQAGREIKKGANEAGRELKKEGHELKRKVESN